jgi:hypothetical protein
MHVQANAHTLCKHRGLPPLSDRVASSRVVYESVLITRIGVS